MKFLRLCGAPYFPARQHTLKTHALTYMQRYRSGHNGADSKSVCGQPHGGSNPSRCARKAGETKVLPLFLLFLLLFTAPSAFYFLCHRLHRVQTQERHPFKNHVFQPFLAPDARTFCINTRTDREKPWQVPFTNSNHSAFSDHPFFHSAGIRQFQHVIHHVC